MKLYKLADNYAALQSIATDPGADQQAIADTLEALQGAIEEKGQNIGHLMLNMDADITALNTEIKRLTERKKTLENRMKWLKSYVQQQMEKAGLTEIKNPTITLRVQANPWRVEVDEGANLPNEYIRTKVMTQPDKEALKKALESGQQIPGARLVRDYSLRIY